MASADLQIPDVAIYNMPAYAANKIKRCPRIFPKNGGQPYKARDTILFELPAQGYLNPQGTTISFDVYLGTYNQVDAVNNGSYYTRLSQYVGSIFKRLRIKYGASYLENIEEAGYLFRQFAVIDDFSDSSASADNVSGIFGAQNLGTTFGRDWLLDSHGVWKSGANVPIFFPCEYTTAGRKYAVRRYQIHLKLGLLQQTKLIPLAFMASQLAIELELADDREVIMSSPSTTNNANTITGTPTYFIDNVTLHPELLEFDARFDDLFFKKGILAGGVPLQFSTWNTYVYPVTSNNMTITIPEKARSLKNIFVFMKAQVPDFTTDYGASFGDFNTGIIDSYQYRIGNMYYPASPVVNTTISGVRTGSVEPLQEFLKALKNSKDRLKNVSNSNWNFQSCEYSQGIAGANVGWPTILGAADRRLGYARQYTSPTSGLIDTTWLITTNLPEFNSGVDSSYFCFAIDLESSNGAEISGLNVEEQSDISLNIKWSGSIPTGVLELAAYCHIDQALLIKDNNRVEHII
jgi:hypothetical protein